MDHKKTPYFTALKEYAEKDINPLDVPGHKRGRIKNDLTDALGDSVFLYDVNAPKGLDNLSRPQSVIKEAQNLMADAFNADKAYFLLNGTTQGIITMILTVVRAHEKIILPRNTHKSIISGLILSGAIPIFLPTIIDEELGISNGFTIDNLIKTIDENPDAKAVFVINTTYFGACTDLKSVVDIAHDNNMLVLVDEAHGSHLSFNDKLPIGAMEAGADMSSASFHKTLGSLTQTSVLLAKGNRVDYNRIRVVINILQSTSPSSIMLASLDVARKQMYFNGKKELDAVIELSEYAKEKITETFQWKNMLKAKEMGFKHYDYVQLDPVSYKAILSKKEIPEKIKNRELFGATYFKLRWGGAIIDYPGFYTFYRNGTIKIVIFMISRLLILNNHYKNLKTQIKRS